MSKKSQVFNQDLQKLQKKLSDMRDIDYDKTKIDFVFFIAEQSATSNYDFLSMLVDRLKLVEQINGQ